MTEAVQQCSSEPTKRMYIHSAQQSKTFLIPYPTPSALNPSLLNKKHNLSPDERSRLGSTIPITVWTSHTQKHSQVCWSQVNSIFCKAFPDLQGRNVVENVSLVILFLFLAISSSFLCATLTLGSYHVVSRIHLCCLFTKKHFITIQFFLLQHSNAYISGACAFLMKLWITSKFPIRLPFVFFQRRKCHRQKDRCEHSSNIRIH